MSAEEKKEREPLEELPTKIVFPLLCTECPGDGVVRAARPHVDWPTPCACKARKQITNYQLARLIDESPKTIVNVFYLRAQAESCERVLGKLFDIRGRLRFERTAV